MKLVFVHGWSVTDQDTYGHLAEALIAAAPPGANLDVQHINLSRYISFHDEVLMEDIARAFEQALRDAQIDGPFSCITHSTGGPVIRLWAHLYYGDTGFAGIPLKHLVRLAPANHGSALAHLGMSIASRIFKRLLGVEPGLGVLNWLELGSARQWELNAAWLGYTPAENKMFPFVLSGQTIDRKFYDFLNPYLVEKGSDGVVRLTAANMNYTHVTLHQDPGTIVADAYIDDTTSQLPVSLLEMRPGHLQKTAPTPFCVVDDASHSGDRIGIMNSVTERNYAEKPVVPAILECLQVEGIQAYNQVYDSFQATTREVQKNDKNTPDQYSMIIFRVRDDRGNPVTDYDMLLLAGNDYRPERMPPGFFKDRQKSKTSPETLTYYMNWTEMKEIPDGKLGIRIAARPEEGFSHYTPCEFRSGDIPLTDILGKNQTLMVDVVLNRHVDNQTYRITKLSNGYHDFKRTKPSGTDIKT